MKRIIPIKWTPQFAKSLRPRPLASDGSYGLVNGDLLFFIYRTSDPYYMPSRGLGRPSRGSAWRSWDKTSKQPYAGNEPLRYRTHWNVWLYFGSGGGTQVGRALKNRRQAKRAARRVLLKKIGALFQ